MEDLINAEVMSSEFAFSHQYPSRIVNSIYFDTFDLKYANQNHNGLSERLKIRLRYYNKISESDSCFLELKKKIGNVGHKQIFPIKSGIKKFLSGESLYELSMKNKVPQYIYFDFINIIPKLLCNYKRAYIIPQCKSFRVTIDTEIKYADCLSIQNFDDCNNLSLKSQNSVIEIKYPIDNVEQVALFAQNLPIRLSKNSKYCEGLKITDQLSNE